MSNSLPPIEGILFSQESPLPWDSKEPPEGGDWSDEHLHEVLRAYWGYEGFRGIQLDIIHSILQGHDTVGLMPTGGGKSVAFQVPALVMKGTCIVVTPLIALMKDQVEHLRSRGIKAVAVHSGMGRSEVIRELDNCILGSYKFLYLSPERLLTDTFLRKLAHIKVSFIAIDEAHCISQWGYDFRPSYLRIRELRRHLPGTPVLALTATATRRVLADIQQQLGFERDNVFRMSFERKNLSYVVRHATDKWAQLVHILRAVKGSAIVYTRSREGSRDVARMLTDEGFTALYYHAGLSDFDKDQRQRAWQTGQVRVMVATNAFGMGIDKSDVRLVVHVDVPDSIEAYFQEAGRAGRDGLRSYAVLIHNAADDGKLLRRIGETFPPKNFVREVYDQLAYYFELAIDDGYMVTYEFNMQKFCTRFRRFPTVVESAIAILAQAGYLLYKDSDEGYSRIMFLTRRDELYSVSNLSTLGDKLIHALLRHYEGLFSEYAVIDESLLAAECGATTDAVYHALLSLTRQRILHYIPRKATPRITYLRRRVDGADLHLPPEVYEHRLMLYKERIEAMLAYVNTSRCRSQMLLEYFDDHSAGECGHCDVCLEAAPRPHEVAACKKRVAELLADGRPHHPSELPANGKYAAIQAEALRQLVGEERLRMADGMLLGDERNAQG